MPHKLRILVVDDSPTDLLLIQEAFSTLEQEVDVWTCNDGATVLAMLQQPDASLPDVILLDINMPKMNGFELPEVLKNHGQLRTIPVVMLTTSNHQKDIDRAYSLAASSYLVKPSLFDQFVEQAKGFLGFWSRCQTVNSVG